jgi:dipeptidyl-peptidase-4
MPAELLLTSVVPQAGEETERRVTHSPLAEFAQYEWVGAEFVSFPSHVDGSTLHGRIALPPDFDPGRTYPAIVGSVYTDSVRNQWGWRTAHPTWGLDQYLLQEGYIIFNVDMRGSWGRGREHRRGIRLDYGGMDIEDLESGVRYLESLGHVDMDRIGIWGSSYGGLMTAMSLFRKPGLYTAGIAGAPATNVWHALTGQMAVMMRPQDQPEEYADSSPFIHAAGLEEPLMIVHGMRDWVVLFKDSVILTQRLILLGKNAELVALPNAGHGWDNEGLAQTRFAFNKMIDFFDRHLAEAHHEASEASHDKN